MEPIPGIPKPLMMLRPIALVCAMFIYVFEFIGINRGNSRENVLTGLDLIKGLVTWTNSQMVFNIPQVFAILGLLFCLLAFIYLVFIMAEKPIFTFSLTSLSVISILLLCHPAFYDIRHPDAHITIQSALIAYSVLVLFAGISGFISRSSNRDHMGAGKTPSVININIITERDLGESTHENNRIEQ